MTTGKEPMQNGAASKNFTLEECAKHNTEKDCWLVIHGKVYDVTEFLDEHPGGYDIVVANTAKDATEDFDEIGHSKTAQEMLEKYLVGIFTGGDPSKLKNISFKSSSGAGQSQQSSFLVTLIKALLPLIILALAIYMSQSGK